MRRLAFTALLCLLAACTIFDDHEPCSKIDGSGPRPGEPVPGELPGTGPTGGDNDATYRMSNGVICRCDGSEVGCYATPEEADRAATCRIDASGVENCQAGETARPPSTGEEPEPAATFRCYYQKIERATGKGKDNWRWQVGKDSREATSKHVDWCDDQTARDDKYRYSCGGCEEP
jgi:hypothetical protein